MEIHSGKIKMCIFSTQSTDILEIILEKHGIVYQTRVNGEKQRNDTNRKRQ